MSGVFKSGEEVRTTCPFCGVGCGILAKQNKDGTISVRGDTDHPASFGKLCPRSVALRDIGKLEHRLLSPQIDGRDCYWDEALELVASKFTETIAAHGPNSVAFYMPENLQTEDYYVANKLMKGFIGSANIDSGCSTNTAQKHAFGSDTMPCTFEDLELADVIVIAGIDLAASHPVAQQRIVAAKAARPDLKLVVIAPDSSETAINADLHVTVHPGGEAALFAGLLQYLAHNSALDTRYIDKYTNGFDDALHSAAENFDQESVKSKTGLKWKQLEQFYALFRFRSKIVTVFPQDADSAGPIINCHLATGRIGRPGMGPFAMATHSDAVGAREVGSSRNMLAAHMELENPEHRDIVQRFWQSPNIAMEAGISAPDESIKAIWLISPDSANITPELEDALADCPFVVVSGVNRESVKTAHVLLPASGWAEKEGTATNFDRYISRQRAFVKPPEDAKPEWWQICEVAKRMGYRDAFSYNGPGEIFAEHAGLSAFENHQRRDFDIGHYARIVREEYDNLDPFQWPQPKQSPRKTTRFFAKGAFYTPDGRGQFETSCSMNLKINQIPTPAQSNQENNWKKSW